MPHIRTGKLRDTKGTGLVPKEGAPDLWARFYEIGTGKPLFVGDASIEVKVSDAQTGVILGAGADRRVGNKRLDADSFDSWDDVYKTLEIWSDMVRYRFCVSRGATNCVKPDV